MKRSISLVFCYALLAGTASADPAVDWRKTALDDIAAAKLTMLDDSPGGVPGEDDAFLTTIDRAAALASTDAQSANSYAGYVFALERFANTFQDDHVWIDFDKPLPAQWPGFMLGYRDGAFQVVETTDPSRVQLGGRLSDCDGVDSETLANRNLEAYVGRWSVASSRREVAPSLLIDRGNPFVARPVRCTLDGAAVTLNWTDIAPDDLKSRKRPAQRIAPQTNDGVRATEDGGYWIGIPTLNALNPAAVAGLETLMKDIETKAPAIRAAKYFVIDLRGNNGGNTFVALRVLNAIWGEGAIADVRPKGLRAEWRASKDNLAYLQAVVPVLKQMFGENSVAFTGIHRVVTGFESSFAKNQALYVDDDEYSILGIPAPVHNRVAAKPFLLTDGACVSSCLNLVDLVVKLPNVVQIGDETASDTYFLENRPAPLPGGHAVLQFPIKRYRNRARLLNESHKPAKYWNGDMADTAAMEHWVATLARS